MTLPKDLLVVLISYFLGCFAAGYYLVRWRTGQDLRTLGSGATGGRNAGRVLGRGGAIITGVLDGLKGMAAVGAAIYWQASPWGIALSIPAVTAGHNWPVQLGFRGGKGLAAAFGATLAFDWRLALIQFGLAAALTALSKRATLSFMLAVALAPITVILLGHDWVIAGGFALTAATILIAHRENITLAIQKLRQPAAQ